VAHAPAIAARWGIDEESVARSIAAVSEAGGARAVLLSTVPLAFSHLQFAALPAQPLAVSTLINTLDTLLADPESGSLTDKTGRIKRLDNQVFGHVRLLVVEDHPANRHVVGAQLSLLGCASQFATDGAAGLEAWQAARDRGAPFSLVLTDLHMPELDGYGLASAIRQAEQAVSDTSTPAARALKQAEPVPIVAFTADGTHDALAQCLSHGMNGILVKPSSLDALSGALRQHNNDALSAIGPRPTPPARLAREPDGDSGPSVQLVAQTGPYPTIPLTAEMRASYQATMREDLRQFESAIASNDADSLRSLAHRIRGAALYTGAHELAVMCKEIEGANHAARPATASRHLIKIVDAINTQH
jgi:CheY-like chemotaxis protein